VFTKQAVIDERVKSSQRSATRSKLCWIGLAEAVIEVSQDRLEKEQGGETLL